MYTGRTLTELAKELERQAEVKQDFRAPTTLMTMAVKRNGSESCRPHAFGVDDRCINCGAQKNVTPELQFSVGDKFTGNPTELMHDQIGKWSSIPAPYYDRMREDAPALLSANVNHWLRQTKETRLVRTLDGTARAFLSNRYRTIDNFDVANATLPVLMNESKKLGSIEVASCDVTEKRLYIKVTSKRLTYEVKKGDVVQAGIVISNSEVGKGSVRIEPFLYRLICLNGAIIEDSAVRKFHLGRQQAEL